MNAVTSTKRAKDWVDPIKEAKAAAALRETLAAMGAGDDEELITDTIEGETQLFEIIDRVLERMADAEVMIEGIKAVAAKLDERKTRFEQRIKADRTALEQALTIAELSKVERPTATLSLSARAPSLTVTEESDIPATFWKAGAPTLDKKTLAQALKDRASALAALPADPEERAAALAALPPEIPGACLSNGAPSLTLRRA